MKILAIETSCDETAIALLKIDGALERPDIKVLGNSLLSQVELHEKYGGVYPNLAKREHEKNLPVLLAKTLEEADEDPDSPEIDSIVVTEGPGLEPALWVGINFALNLGKKWSAKRRIPVVPVNHMEGHIFSSLFEMPEGESLALPALALLVSGGHTELVVVRNFRDYEIIGRTRDDAVGEAFDKVARMLGLTYPGGPKISRLAEISRNKKETIDLVLPQPMLHSKDLDFSFSGLKTAVLYKLKLDNRSDEEYKEDMARAFEDAAIGVLVEKTRKALLREEKIKTLIVGGGVSANLHLSQELGKLIDEFPNIKLRLPTKSLTTDNAIMIGIAGFIRITKEPKILKNQVEIKAQGNLSIS